MYVQRYCTLSEVNPRAEHQSTAFALLNQNMLSTLDLRTSTLRNLEPPSTQRHDSTPRRFVCKSYTIRAFSPHTALLSRLVRRASPGSQLASLAYCTWRRPTMIMIRSWRTVVNISASNFLLLLHLHRRTPIGRASHRCLPPLLHYSSTLVPSLSGHAQTSCPTNASINSLQICPRYQSGVALFRRPVVLELGRRAQLPTYCS